MEHLQKSGSQSICVHLVSSLSNVVHVGQGCFWAWLAVWYSTATVAVDDTAVHPTDYVTSVLIAIFRLNRPWVHLLQVLRMSPQCQLPTGPDPQSQMNMPLELSRPHSLKLWFLTLGVTPAYWHVCKETDTLLWVCTLHLCTGGIQKVEGFLTVLWNTGNEPPWTMFFAESARSIFLGSTLSVCGRIVCAPVTVWWFDTGNP